MPIPNTSDAWREANRVEALLKLARKEPLRPAAISSERAHELIESVRQHRDTR